VRLEGWLLKKKSKDKSSILFKNENLRWFRIQEVEGSDQSELALCYYGSQKDKEAKGWIYLKDVTHIYDEKKTFTIVSDARTMTLEAQSPPEHMLWVQALGNYCQNASSGIKGKSSGAKEVESYKQDDRGSRNSSRRPSANNDDHQPPVAENKAPSPALTSLFSRYAQNTGDKSSFYNQPSSNAHPMPSLHSASEDYEYGEPELSGADQVTSTLDNNYSNYPNNSKNWKEDHRVKGYRGADVTSSATNRLHKFITKETVPDTGIAARRGKEAKDEDDQEEEELESLTLSNENQSRARQRHRQQHLLQERQVRNSKEGRFIKPIDSSFTITADEGKRSDDDEEEDNEENERGRGRVQRGGARGRGYSEDDDDDPSRSPPRRQTSSRSGREENEDDRTPPREGGEDDNDEDSRPRRNTSERGGGKRVVKAGAVPLPSNAPPRRARDALVEAEATQKTRRSIDDVLFKRGNNDSKTLSRENSARNSSANDSPPPQRGGGGGAGSSSDEEFDIKAEIKKYGPGSHNKEFMESTTSTTASTSSNNTSRPPRFPQPNSNKSSPYPTTTHPNAYQQPPPQRGSTPPPRVSHNPGAQVDRNFVTADWDEEEENKEEGKQGGGGSGRTKSYYQKTNYGSVQADENWLDENFDEN